MRLSKILYTIPFSSQFLNLILRMRFVSDFYFIAGRLWIIVYVWVILWASLICFVYNFSESMYDIEVFVLLSFELGYFEATKKKSGFFPKHSSKW
jgi:hypothetical protein